MAMNTGCDPSAQAKMLTFTLRPAAPGPRGFWEVGRAACLEGLAFTLGAIGSNKTLKACERRLQD